ncbi:hypothetical protein ADM96_08285 [Burkholderia sp. ST111]|nr:hypothetical protein ADM96_08285 [Burkholderia sp. ST111]
MNLFSAAMDLAEQGVWRVRSPRAERLADCEALLIEVQLACEMMLRDNPNNLELAHVHDFIAANLATLEGNLQKMKQ